MPSAPPQTQTEAPRWYSPARLPYVILATLAIVSVACRAYLALR